MRFDPEGATGNPEIPFAKSLPDYIMRWLASRFLDVDIQEELGIMTPEVRARKAAQDALMRGDTAGPAAPAAAPAETNGGGGGNGAANGGGNGHAKPKASQPAKTVAAAGAPAGNPA